MKRRWQVWLCYAAALGVALTALGWLSVTVLRLERAEATSRAQAEQEELIRLALWRIDTKLTPIVAREMARPYEAYSSFYPVSAKRDRQMPTSGASPLLVQPGKYVLLNFEIRPDGTWTSPQCPSEEFRELALANGSTAERISESQGRLNALRKEVDYAQLLALVPRQTLPAVSPLDANAVAVGDSQAAQSLEKQLEQAQSFNSFGSGTDNDLLRRAQALRTSNVKEIVQQRANVALPAPTAGVAEGLGRAVWVGGHLVLARQVAIRGQTIVQGCWLDWRSLKRDLLAEVADLLPAADLESVREPSGANYAHMLATLPVELVAPPPIAGVGSFTPLRTSLVIAWAALALAAGALAVLVMGVVALGERREAFVSAVTHELRTPLTTFRVYTEMLEQDMLPDQESRKEYLHTLGVEANRLTHLVENVLAYARLERGRLAAKRERATVGELLGRVIPRLSQRTAHSGMELAVAADQNVRDVRLDTDPTAVEQILFNLVDNACKYAAGATRKIVDVLVEADDRTVRLRVRDHGPGIGSSDTRRLFQPFSKSAQQAAATVPGVGLGLALSRRLARQLGGDLVHEPLDEQGTSFCLLLPRVVR
jgi:signal transduction histidine kinase